MMFLANRFYNIFHYNFITTVCNEVVIFFCCNSPIGKGFSGKSSRNRARPLSPNHNLRGGSGLPRFGLLTWVTELDGYIGYSYNLR